MMAPPYQARSPSNLRGVIAIRERWLQCLKGSLNINLVMVKEGRAVAYRKYLSPCDGDKYLSAEASAKSWRLAFWSQNAPIMPWDFRRGVRARQATPLNFPQLQQNTASNCDRSYPDVCIPPAPPDLDCGDIPHRRFRVIGNDPHRFDGDRDGIGCER